jgi:cell division protein DivIC
MWPPKQYVDKTPSPPGRFFLDLAVMKRFFRKIWPWLKNKYVLTISLFMIWMLFFDQYNLVDRLKMSSQIRQLEADREYYLEQIEKDSTRLHELTTDKENLEKYAREQYFMKKSNEDVFVIVEK